MFRLFKPHSILFLAVVSVFTYACKKELTGTGEITFTINEQYTQQPVANASVKLSATQLDGGSFNSNFVILQEKQSSVNGSVTFIEDISNLVELKGQFAKSGFFPTTLTFDKDDFDSKSKYSGRATMLEKAWVSVHLKSEDQSTNKNELAFSLKTGNPSCGCCSSSTRFLNEFSVDSSWVCAIPANRYLRYEYAITADGGKVYYADSVYITPGDTAGISLTF